MPALELKLPQVARIEADGTIGFNASGISTFANVPQTYMIFYLTQNDEQNGYGTVIQLDELHQAYIYPDLNPEYTYLFYKDDQGSIQTLLWCIEFATRTTEGLYVTQAKIHGRGVTEEDMRRFNQIMVAPPNASQSGHQLSEAYTPSAPAAENPSATPPAAAVASTAAAPIIDTSGTAPATAAPSPIPQTSAPMANAAVTPPAPSQADGVLGENSQTSPQNNPLPDAAPPMVAAPTNTAAIQEPELGQATIADQPAASIPPTPPTQPDLLAPMPGMAAETESQPANATSVQPEPAVINEAPPSAAPEPTPAPADAVADIVSQPLVLPELPPLPDHMPAFDGKIDYTPPTPDTQPIATATPATESTAAENQPTPAPKNPVGRPPKPLLSDAAWRVEQSDFAWAKSISRDAIGPNKMLLRQKVMDQIERNEPELLQNQSFLDAFDAAFAAICQTYELAPTARQDILKSLLNGRVVENIASSL